MDKSCHLSDCTSINDSLDESSTLSAQDDHLHQLDSPNTSFQLQDTSCFEIEFVHEFKGQLDHGNLSQTGVFLEHHEYELFLLNQEIDIPSDSLSYQESHHYEKLCQDDPFFAHATDFSLTLALPHFMAQHKCEDLNPTGTPSTVPPLAKLT